LPEQGGDRRITVGAGPPLRAATLRIILGSATINFATANFQETTTWLLTFVLWWKTKQRRHMAAVRARFSVFDSFQTGIIHPDYSTYNHKATHPFTYAKSFFKCQQD
jgi:hypothetical protein